MAKHMVRVSIHGITARFMTANGIKVSSMAMGYGEASQETLTLASGDILRLRGTEYILGKMETVMKENGSNVSNMVKELISSRTETPTLESIKKESQMAKGNTLGKMAPSMWESSDKVSNMVREGGRAPRDLNRAISMKETTRMTKSMVSECSLGQVATFTRVSTERTRETATGK